MADESIIGQNEEQVEPEKITLIIDYYPKDGKVDLKGPLQNRLLVYGMLEMARELIYEFKFKDVKLKIPTERNILSFVREKFK